MYWLLRIKLFWASLNLWWYVLPTAIFSGYQHRNLLFCCVFRGGEVDSKTMFELYFLHSTGWTPKSPHVYYWSEKRVLCLFFVSFFLSNAWKLLHTTLENSNDTTLACYSVVFIWQRANFTFCLGSTYTPRGRWPMSDTGTPRHAGDKGKLVSIFRGTREGHT